MGEPADIVQYLDPADLPSARLTPRQRRVLDELNRRAAAAESLEDLIRFVFDSTRGIYPCDRLSVAFLEDDGRRVVSGATAAAYEPLRLGPGYSADLAGSSLAEVIRTGRCRIIADLQAYLRLHPGSGPTRLLVEEGVRSSLTCPLAVEGRNVALLFRSARRADAYGPREVRLHAATAERLAQAVEKAYRIRQLTEANRAYLEMLGFVSHELKGPVAAMVMDAGVLADGYLGEVTPRQRDMARRMIDKGQYLLGLIREYLDLARLEAGRLEADVRSGVDFAAEVLAPAVEIVRGDLERANMRLSLPAGDEPLPVACDPGLMKTVLVNLLANAAKYGSPGGQVRVTACRDGDALAVSVWNEGPGFPPAQRGRLFRKFSRLETPGSRQAKGTGVGLYTVWRIVRLHGGEVWADSQEGTWAEFGFRIPAGGASVRDPSEGAAGNGR